MAFTGNAVCTSFKLELLKGVHDFSTHTFKLALYDNTATLTAATEAYTSEGEISGGDYVAGGLTLAVESVAVTGSAAVADFADTSVGGGTISARGALIYNSTVSGNPAVAVLDFGSVRTASEVPFSITFPAPGAETAVVRIR